jgi:hypothetical protein
VEFLFLKLPGSCRYLSRRILLSLFGEPAHRYPAVTRIDLDPDRLAVALSSGNTRAPAAHEGIEYGVADKREEFHAPQWQLDQEGSGL